MPKDNSDRIWQPGMRTCWIFISTLSSDSKDSSYVLLQQSSYRQQVLIAPYFNKEWMHLIQHYFSLCEYSKHFKPHATIKHTVINTTWMSLHNRRKLEYPEVTQARTHAGKGHTERLQLKSSRTPKKPVLPVVSLSFMDLCSAVWDITSERLRFCNNCIIIRASHNTPLRNCRWLTAARCKWR